MNQLRNAGIELTQVFTTEEEIDYVAEKTTDIVNRLREMSPLYEMVKEGVDLSKVEWQSN